MDATELFSLRASLKETIPDITLLPFFMKAISLAFLEYPEMNCVVSPNLDEKGYI